MTVRRTGKLPDANDTFLMRICYALDEPPRMLASNLGIPYGRLEPLLQPKHAIADLDEDEVWWALHEYVGQKIGMLMAVKFELQRATQRERQRRAARHTRLKETRR